MKLVTKEVEKRLEKFPIRSQENVENKKVLVKFFIGSCTWIVTEAEKMENGDWEFFGWVNLGYGGEWGYFRLSEFADVKVPIRLSNIVIGYANVEREQYEHFGNGYVVNFNGEIHCEK